MAVFFPRLPILSRNAERQIPNTQLLRLPRVSAVTNTAKGPMSNV
jgi:hypothetical protein